MKVLITGGHFSPAYALIKELKKRGHQVLIAGRKYPFEDDRSESLEYKIAKDEKLSFFEVRTGRFQRKFSAYTLNSLLKTPFGVFSSFKIIKHSKPDVVLTFGGYVALPIAFCAKILGIPVVLHEQTQGAGLASKIIGKFANKICISFESSRKFFPKAKTVLTGNPVRKEIFEVNKKLIIPEGKVIYVTGGSTGSHFINSIIYEIISELLQDFIVVHQTGESLKFGDFEKLTRLRDSLPQNLQKKYILRKFIFPDEIGDVFNKTDLILSRSGANIMYEIMVMSKLSLLIPLPHGQNEEQLANAKFLKDLGISEFILEKDATGEKVLAEIQKIFKESFLYKKNMEKAKKQIQLDASEEMASLVEETGVKKKS